MSHCLASQDFKETETEDSLYFPLRKGLHPARAVSGSFPQAGELIIGLINNR